VSDGREKVQQQVSGGEGSIKKKRLIEKSELIYFFCLLKGG